MIQLLLKRKYLKEDYTIGSLFIRNNYFCDTLEDKVRDKDKNGILDEQKIYGKTAIPYGEYKIIITRSPKFKRDLPLLLNVPNFEGILIHAGNTAKDSSGCILVGENKQKGKLINSRATEDKLMAILKAYFKTGEKLKIKII